MTASRRLLEGSPAHLGANRSLPAVICKVPLEGRVSSRWADRGTKKKAAALTGDTLGTMMKKDEEKKRRLQQHSDREVGNAN